MKRSLRTIISIAVVLLLVFSLGTAVFAGTGSGDGSGGGSGSPLTLDVSSVPDGSTDVPVDVRITLTFTKNVVNFAVREHNMGCFVLTDDKGNEVPITVEMGDDQVDPSVKRVIEIVPGTLSEGVTYTLTVKGELQAKNGTYMGEDLKLSFTTEGAAAKDNASGRSAYYWLIPAAAAVLCAVGLTAAQRKKKQQ